MSSKERADQEIIDSEAREAGLPGETWTLEGIEHPLMPLQFHSLSLLQQLIALKNDYQTDPQYEKWLMSAINKSIYATLRDCIEANVGEEAKELLRKEHQVN